MNGSHHPDLWTVRSVKTTNRGYAAVREYSRDTKREAIALARRLRNNLSTKKTANITRFGHTYVVSV